MEEQKRLEIETPKGTLVAYASIDPNNPGIYIDLERDGIGYALNLACVECQIDEDPDKSKIVSHIWGDAQSENTTQDIKHHGLDAYFQEEEA